MHPRRFALLFLAVWFGCLFPIFVSRILPLADFPNHLARYEILAHPDEPFYRAFWQPAWAFLPNLGSDLLVVGLAKLMPTILAGRVGVSLIIGLIGFGFAWVHREWSGRWEAWGLLGLPIAWAWPMQMGFVNYMTGFGVLLVVLAAHLRLRERPLPQYLVVLVPLSLVLVVCHFLAFCFLLVVVATLEVAFTRTKERVPLRIGAVAMRLGLITILPIVYVLAGPAAQDGSGVVYAAAIHKFRMIWLAVAQGNLLVDAIVLLLLAAGVYVASRGEWRPARAGMILTAVLIAAYIVTPMGYKGALHVDSRQPFGILLLFLALSSGRICGAGGWLVGAALGLHIIGVTFTLHKRSAALDRLSSAMSQLPEGTLISVAISDFHETWAMRNWYPPLMHAASVGLLDHRLYPVTLFQDPSQQPLKQRPEVAALAFLQEERNLSFPERQVAKMQKLRQQTPLPWRTRPLAILFASGKAGAQPGPGATLIAHEGRWGLYLLDDPPRR